jgi:dolichyl-phosphate beta-glucosyltransferase
MSLLRPYTQMAYTKHLPGVSIIIPAFNEEQRLPRTLSEIQRYCTTLEHEFEVIVVDDGSTDGTVELVSNWAAGMPWLSVLECPHRGKGAAVRAGVLAARNGRVILCDADLSMPVDQFDRLLAVLDRGCDVAVGSRALPSSRIYHDPLRRRIMSRIFNLLVQALVVPGVHDTQCGFKAFRHEAAHDLFSRQRLDGFSFDAEILLIARRQGYSIREVGIDWYFDADSRVHAVTDSLKMVLDLLQIRFQALLGAYRSAADTYAVLNTGAIDIQHIPVEAIAITARHAE